MNADTNGQRVWVTRPMPACAVWVQALRQQGLDAWPAPLLEIGPSPDPAALRASFDAIADQSSTLDAIMWVSSAAIAGAVDTLGPTRMAHMVQWAQQGCRFWVTGPGSAKALHVASIPWASIDRPAGPVLDSEGLWATVGAQVKPGWRVALVRGADASGRVAGNPWLAQQLTAKGASVVTWVAYQRMAPCWPDEQRQRVLQAPTHQDIWLFSSSQGLNYLPERDWTGGRALATHPRIAAQVAAKGFSVVKLTSPVLDQVIASLKSFND